MRRQTIGRIFALVFLVAASGCGDKIAEDEGFGDLEAIRERIIAFEHDKQLGADGAVVEINLNHLAGVLSDKLAKLDPNARRFSLSSTVIERELTDGDIESELRGSNPVRGNLKVRSASLDWNRDAKALNVIASLDLELKADIKGHVRVIGVRTPYQTTAGIDADRTLYVALKFSDLEEAWLDLAAVFEKPDNAKVSYSVDVIQRTVQVKGDFKVDLPVGATLVQLRADNALNYQMTHTPSLGVIRNISATVSPIATEVQGDWLTLRAKFGSIEAADHVVEN